VFVTAGLGGMSGAQAKAAVICGCVGVIAEVSLEALQKRWANFFKGIVKREYVAYIYNKQHQSM
jgi:urocanate hydratase